MNLQQSRDITLDDLKDFFEDRRRKLDGLQLRDVIAKIDTRILLENITESAGEFLASLIARRLEQAAEIPFERTTSESHDNLVHLLRDARLLNDRIQSEAAWARAHNRLCRDFTNIFCDEEGAVDWDALVRFNSSKTPPSSD